MLIRSALKLHNNRLKSLPDSMADLTALTMLDVSHNSLESLPVDIFALPNLTALNVSHNSLTCLLFSAPFSGEHSAKRGSRSSGDGFFVPTVERATSPLPRLITLDASHNKITASGIDHMPSEIPKSISKVNLSANPLGDCRTLLRALAKLGNLTELRMEEADVSDSSFPADLLTSVPLPFPRLRIFDLGNTMLTTDVVRVALRGMKQELSLDVTAGDPPQGTLRLMVGKVIVKEAWEIEAEQRAKLRKMKSSGHGWPMEKEDKVSELVPLKKQEVVKETWEIEAEKGLLTEGGRRRARAAATAEPESSPNPSVQQTTSPTSPTSSLAKHYNPSTQTLKLPQSTPPARSPMHARALSYAAPTRMLPTGKSMDLALPAPTVPLEVIAVQPFAQTLRVLVLDCRRLDRSFSLPPAIDSLDGRGVLPLLEELSLEGCALGDVVATARARDADGSPERSSEPLLPLIAQVFPTLRMLNLSGNLLTSASLTRATLMRLFVGEAPHRPGLRQLRLRGNRLNDVDGLREVALAFKGNRDVPGWALEELDLSDNEIGKLPPELGLLPLEVFLVDGNT